MPIDEARVHAGISKRVKDRDGGYTDYTINLSGIPAVCDNSYIDMMLARANYATEKILEEIDGRINAVKPINKTAFLPTVQQPALTVVEPEPEPNPVETIPDEDDVQTAESSAFGISIPFPLYEWLSDPLTKEGGDSGGGQCKALNTALSEAGFSKRRHEATLEILRAYGPIWDHATRTKLGSISDLNKAEAHIVITWFGLADDSKITDLWKAVRSADKEAVLV